MRLHVIHRLHYTYSDAIFLEPHLIYLHPKAYPHQQVIQHSIVIDPQPSMLVHNLDPEGNHQHRAYFKDSTTSLTISVEMCVQSEPFNVFEFVLFPFETEHLPFQYPDTVKKYLQPYLVRDGVTTYVEQFARQIASYARWKTVLFLTTLSRTIYETFVYERREVGPPMPPELTLIGRKGSCRDFAQLFVACCRSIGIAARFVSGYLYGNPLQEHDLHAWAEVYLPGAGWRGFDPTEGKAVINHHVHLAASGDPQTIAPVSGTFRGKALSSLIAEVTVSEAKTAYHQ
ncbi:MAG: transglutaminase domain-containing protein [Runella sp.]